MILNESRLLALLIFFTCVFALVFALTLMYFSDRFLKILVRWERNRSSTRLGASEEK